MYEGNEMNEALTPEQLGLMRHAVGHFGRNYFVTDCTGPDGIVFEELVARGLALAQETPTWISENTVYHLTEKGKQLVEAFNER